ncbi:predicted protein [Histoplasma capsulatum var. duboisii H88]|uniref:Predicted protein n=1 Tax=Ajellomyces capsulatus (strain H88) TaxID=544711 RepID=F0UM13_AJEC8|nr:predicted protein [Histoplasma capsulatum var. duboisii H88]
MSNPGYTPNEPRNELDHRPGPVMAKQGDPQIVNLLPTLFTFPLRSAFILVLTGATSLMDIRLTLIFLDCEENGALTLPMDVSNSCPFMALSPNWSAEFRRRGPKVAPNVPGATLLAVAWSAISQPCRIVPQSLRQLGIESSAIFGSSP